MRLGAARNPQDAISIDRPAKNTCGTALLNENSSSHAVFFPIGIPYKKKNTKHIIYPQRLNFCPRSFLVLWLASALWHGFFPSKDSSPSCRRWCADLLCRFFFWRQPGGGFFPNTQRLKIDEIIYGRGTRKKVFFLGCWFSQIPKLLTWENSHDGPILGNGLEPIHTQSTETEFDW